MQYSNRAQIEALGYCIMSRSLSLATDEMEGIIQLLVFLYLGTSILD